MNDINQEKNLRILVVDDNRAIHDDFRKILCQSDKTQGNVQDDEAVLFDAPKDNRVRVQFEVDSAYQGREGLTMVEEAVGKGRPYAMVFLDVRMPPGWDGVETAAHLWAACPDLQIVICTAYSDYSWDEMAAKLDRADQLLILKKPFDSVEVLQLANALTGKWRLQQQARLKLDGLEELVQERTRLLWETNSALQAEVTERKAAHDRIHEQAMLLDLAHDAIYVRDLAGHIQFWNKGAERLYGWMAAEVIGKTNDEIFCEDAFAPNLAQQALLETGEWSGELRRHNRLKQEVVVDSHWTLLRDAEGKPRSVLIISADVTEKKKLESQFLRAQRMEGIGTLATGMAHDLNNILAPILMSAGVLRWEGDAAERKSAIDCIEASVKRGAAIIQQVLTFGRGVSGERVEVNPGDILSEISKIVSQTFPKSISISVDEGDGVWPIIGDKTQIHQVLLNLCINARDAMPHGGNLSLRAGNVTVDKHFAALHSPMQAGPYNLLQVEDTGEGISAATLEKIFDPFFTTKEIGKGTGLGLSTVLGIVKSHRGVVTVESEVGKGTRFKVFLPAAPALIKSEAALESGALARGHGEAILVVDDETSVANTTRKMLEHYGYQVVVANRGEEALANFLRKEPSIDLVLTDMMMPGMDGIALIQALRKVDPHIGIIASSGLGRYLAGNERAAELTSLGIKSFLDKPYTAEKLLTALHDSLANKTLA